jgi:hypothetical protein
MQGGGGPWQQLGGMAVEALGLFVQGAIVYVSAWLASRKAAQRTARKSHQQLNLELRDDIDVNVVLDRTLQATGALRCFLSRLHNGDNDISMRKKTRTHERTARGVRYQSQEFRAMPTSRVPEEMALVLDDGASWKAVAELPESLFKELCEEGGAGCGGVSRVAVKCGKDVMGFIGADFAQLEPPPNLKLLETCARDVARILSRYH